MTPLESSLPRPKRSGFTLVEVLIYAGIAASIFGFSLLAVYGLLTGYSRQKAQREVLANAEFLAKKIEWALRDAAAVNSPAPGATSSVLSLNKNGVSFNPFVFDSSAGAARLAVGGGVPVSLTNGYVAVRNLVFENLNFQNSAPAVKVSFTVRSANSVSNYFTNLETTFFLK